MNRVVVWTLLVTAVGLGSPTVNGCASDDLDASWELAYFNPFSVCGLVTHMETSPNFTADLTMPSRDWGCTIGCVRRRSDAVRIRVLACNDRSGSGSGSGASSISLSGMRFRGCSEDNQYTVKGVDADHWIVIRLHPDITCLRNRASGSCGRIIDYERVDSLNVLKDIFFTRMISIGLKKNRWKALSNNQANQRLPASRVCWLMLASMIRLIM